MKRKSPLFQYTKGDTKITLNFPPWMFLVIVIAFCLMIFGVSYNLGWGTSASALFLGIRQWLKQRGLFNKKEEQRAELDNIDKS